LRLKITLTYEINARKGERILAQALSEIEQPWIDNLKPPNYSPQAH